VSFPGKKAAGLWAMTATTKLISSGHSLSVKEVCSNAAFYGIIFSQWLHGFA
jgi:hypothetical protein